MVHNFNVISKYWKSNTIYVYYAIDDIEITLFTYE